LVENMRVLVAGCVVASSVTTGRHAACTEH
jgi:hypothetical protein